MLYSFFQFYLKSFTNIFMMVQAHTVKIIIDIQNFVSIIHNRFFFSLACSLCPSWESDCRREEERGG